MMFAISRCVCRASAVLLAGLLISLEVKAQKASPVRFAERSSTAYKKDIAYYTAREVPVAFPKSREAQRVYKEMAAERNAYILASFTEDEIVKDSILLGRCQAVINQLRTGNPAYPLKDIRCYISRSAEPNARCFGEGTLFIHTGIFPLIRNDAELAFIMGHEIAHQLLLHPDARLRTLAERRSSSAFKKEVRSIRNDPGSYGDRYFTLLRRVWMEDGENDRQAENEADSMAMILVRNAGYNADEASRFILTLAHADDLISGSDLYDVQKYLPPSGTAPARAYVGLSGVKVNLKKSTELDSLRMTHPDAPSRYTRMTGNLPPANLPVAAAVVREAGNPETGRQFLEMIRYFLENGRYTLALHYAILAQETGQKDPVFNDVIAASLAAIYAADRRGDRYEATYVFTSTANSLRALQNALGALKRDDLAALSDKYLQKNADTTTDSWAWADATYRICAEGTTATTVYNEYQSKYPLGRFLPLLKQTAFPKSHP